MYFVYFYPVGIDQPTRRRPILSLALMAVMVVAFVWFRYFPAALPLSPYALIFYPGFGSPWSVVSAVFLHAGWLHLLGNLVYLQAFAPALEDRFGPGRLLLYFLVLGVFGNLAHGLATAAGWLGAGGTGVLGASGAIAGLLAMSLVRFPTARLRVAWWVFAPLMGQNRAGRTGVPVVVAVALWILLQIAQALLSSETGSGVSFAAHLGGFAAGLFLAMIMGEWREARAEARRTTARRYFDGGQYHAAVGAWTEYLALRPDDHEARLDLARSQRLAGRPGEARLSYRHVFDGLLAAGEVASALDVYSEVGRSRIDLQLQPSEMNLIAYYREKQLDHQGAVEVYRQLYRTYPQTLTGQRALVRAISLLAKVVRDERAAADLLALARRELPAGAWRGYLERNFSLGSVPDAADEADLPAPVGPRRS